MEFEYRPEIDVEGDDESAIMCSLDPRKDCAPECHLYTIMQTLWLNYLKTSCISYPSLVETFRDPGNEKLLEDFRKRQSETLRRIGFIESCSNYPQADITSKFVGGPGFVVGMLGCFPIFFYKSFDGRQWPKI